MLAAPDGARRRRRRGKIHPPRDPAPPRAALALPRAPRNAPPLPTPVRSDPPVTVALGPGARLHVLQSDRFTTTFARVVLHHDLARAATPAALLGPVLRAATARHPSREALAHRLAELYGASLVLGSEKLGDRGLFTASLEWPTGGLARSRGLVAEGLALLREALTEPRRGADGGLDPGLVRTEQVNQRRTLEALRDDKGRYALRRALESACAGEAFGLEVEGRLEELSAATPGRLGALHARLLAHAPLDVFLAGDLSPRAAEGLVRRHLLWPGRSGAVEALPPAGSVRAARPRPRRLVERQPLSQGKLVMVFRAPIGATHALCPAARTLAGVLGGGPYARLFKVVRETHGLCYYASAGWVEAKGLMIVSCGIDPAHEPRVRRLILSLVAEVSSGRLEPEALHGYREAVAHRLASLADGRGAAVAFAQEALTLGTSPSPERRLAELGAVRPAQVRAAGRRLRLDTTFFLGSSRPAAGGRTA